MQPLNLPDFDVKIIKEDGKRRIFDFIRKKYVVLTPEEWVRQHFLHYLTDSLKYPRSLIRIETGIQKNTLPKRTDILVHDRTGKPWMVVECKAPEIKLDRNCFNQALMYNMVLGAQYISVTNGLLHYCFRAGTSVTDPEFLPAIPAYEG